MKNQPSNSGEIAALCIFSLERCQQKVSHIRAVMHLLSSEAGAFDSPFSMGIAGILGGIEQELEGSISLLRMMPEFPEN